MSLTVPPQKWLDVAKIPDGCNRVIGLYWYGHVGELNRVPGGPWTNREGTVISIDWFRAWVPLPYSCYGPGAPVEWPDIAPNKEKQ